MGDAVRIEVDGGVGVIRLDRPPANAIDRETAADLAAAVSEAAERDDVGALVVWGGPKIFAAGADIREMAEWGSEEIRPAVEALAEACDLLEHIPKVSIAAINGYALGGGLELALGADLRYLADDGAVGLPEIRIGVIPGAGGTQRLARVVGPGRARELIYTGRIVDADEAYRRGIVERILPPAKVFDRAVEDAGRLAAGPREALAAAKAAIRAAAETPGEPGMVTERERFLPLFGTPDQREGMRAFLEKRDPDFGSSPPSRP